MNKGRLEFEIYLEILTQIKLGNLEEKKILSCTNLSYTKFNEMMDPLISEKLLKKIQVRDGEKSKIIYQITEKGSQFIEYIQMGIDFVEEKVPFIK